MFSVEGAMGRAGGIGSLLGDLRDVVGDRWALGWRRRGDRVLCWVTVQRQGRSCTVVAPTLRGALVRALAAGPAPRGPHLTRRRRI